MSRDALAVAVVVVVAFGLAVLVRRRYGSFLLRVYGLETPGNASHIRRADIVAGVKAFSWRVLALQAMALPLVIFALLTGAPMFLLIIFAYAMGVTLAGLAIAKGIEWRKGRAAR